MFDGHTLVFVELGAVRVTAGAGGSGGLEVTGPLALSDAPLL